jgi:phosphoglycerate kinase
MKKLQSFNFKGKNVLVRCDFNIPFSKEGEVLDDFRIKMALPTLNYLIKEKARVILISHLETKKEKLSLEKILPVLEKNLQKKVKFLVNYLGENSRKEIEKLEPGQVILLENVRFHKGEKENDLQFAKRISQLGDIFVNEAFSVCHRRHASIVSLPKYLPKAAGFLLEKEVGVFSNLLNKPKRPFVAIIGGIKIGTKIKTILNILKIADNLILGSKIGEVIFAQKGIIIGRDFDEVKLIEKIDLTDPKIHFPLDGVIALKDLTEGYLRKGGIGSLRTEEDVFDIGPETIKIFKKVLKSAKTILWNGPLGMHEDKRFEQGTKTIADAIVRNYSALKIAGGGETVSAINTFGLSDKFDFLSTGGGAMLEFLAGEKLPGIEALD